MRLLLMWILTASIGRPLLAQTRYEIGTPVLRDVWVDGRNGNDSKGGASRADALRTLTEAWNRIPKGVPLTGSGYRILLTAGTYAKEAIPNYFESRYGTATAPIIIQSADGSRTARLLGDLNIFDTRYLYVVGLDLRPQPAGDVYHCELCDHILIRDSNLDGGARVAHDMTKINQSQYVYIEDSTLSGAEDNTIDFVAVQYGHVIGNRISNAQDWCMYAKGGSAYLRIDSNEFFNCGTGGFTAGQGTGFQFMTSPWIHYEAYDIKVINNLVHDTEGAGLGVNGGYDILLAYNTLYRLGTRDHMLEVTFGNRSCDGNPGDAGRDRCQAYLDAGGWGTTVVDDGSNYVRIPSRHVFIYDNLLFNSPGTVSAQTLSIAGPYSGSTQTGSNVPDPVLADEDLQIRGNVIINAGLLGIGDDTGCRPSNATCNELQLRRDNSINRITFLLGSDLRPLAGSTLFSQPTFVIPDFAWSDAPSRPRAPAGLASNRVPRDRAGEVRNEPGVAGAYARASDPSGPRRRAVTP